MKNPQPKPTAPETPLASYKIITGAHIDLLEQHVNESIASGFLPVGNVSMCGNLLVQGMLKQGA